MAESWGNGTEDKYNEDLVSNPANKNILKVNDVNDGNDAKIAGHFVNSSNNGNARALKVQGKSELEIDANTVAVMERNRVSRLPVKRF